MSVRISDHESQLLGCRDQDVGWIRTLPASLVRRRIARPSLDGDGEAHLPHRYFKIAGNVDGQGLERRDIKCVKPLALGRGRKLNQAWQKACKSLATPRRRHEQDASPGPDTRKHVQLMPPRAPTPLLKPTGEGFGQN